MPSSSTPITGAADPILNKMCVSGSGPEMKKNACKIKKKSPCFDKVVIIAEEELNNNYDILATIKCCRVINDTDLSRSAALLITLSLSHN